MNLPAINSVPSSQPAPGQGSSTGNSEPAQDRFLKLLVAQLSNQDPMNPLDNAQMTSQIAQINTVSGIEQLHQTLKGMATQFSTWQAIQGVNLVGHEVLSSGNTLEVEQNKGKGAMLLAQDADSVKVELLNASGQVVDSLDLGAKNAGPVLFDWPNVLAGANQSFRISASASGQSVAVKPMLRRQVLAVGLEGGATTLQLQGGKSIPYSAVEAIL